jgi:hypothetical protein
VGELIIVPIALFLIRLRNFCCCSLVSCKWCWSCVFTSSKEVYCILDSSLSMAAFSTDNISFRYCKSLLLLMGFCSPSVIFLCNTFTHVHYVI